jgi:hypothetical protein
MQSASNFIFVGNFNLNSTIFLEQPIDRRPPPVDAPSLLQGPLRQPSLIEFMGESTCAAALMAESRLHPNEAGQEYSGRDWCVQAG